MQTDQTARIAWETFAASPAPQHIQFSPSRFRILVLYFTPKEPKTSEVTNTYTL